MRLALHFPKQVPILMVLIICHRTVFCAQMHVASKIQGSQKGFNRGKTCNIRECVLGPIYVPHS